MSLLVTPPDLLEATFLFQLVHRMWMLEALLFLVVPLLVVSVVMSWFHPVLAAHQVVQLLLDLQTVATAPESCP